MLQNELVTSLYHEEFFDELLHEADDVAQRRKQCVEFLSALKKSMAVLNELRDVAL